MIRSSIDIGTNSVLLLVADCHDQTLDVLHEEQSIPRLGQGVDQSGALSDTAQQRVLEVLLRYRNYMEKHYPDAVDGTIVTATSAVRDATNRREFLDRIKEATGWSVRLLSGDDEARTTYRGALSVLEFTENTDHVVLDIGGGSTEIAIGQGADLHTFVSLDMGSVRFTERFLRHDPPTAEELEAERREIRAMLTNWRDTPLSYDHLIGVAGTVTSMAGIELGLSDYDANKINGHRCSLEFIEEKISEFIQMDSEQIEEKYPVFLGGRGDVITGGLIILTEFMKWTGKKEVVISTGGIRHGVTLES